MKLTYDQSLVSDAQLTALVNQLADYRERLEHIAAQTTYQEPESSLALPSDERLLADVRDLAARLRSPTLQYVIVIGIGGSNLGAQAVYEAVAGSMNLLVDRLPKLLFLDTVTDEKMTAVMRVLEHLSSREDFLVIAVTKSGTTTETVANTEVIWKFVEEQFGNARDRFVFITDEDSKLWRLAKEKKAQRLPVPALVGGRFSVFCAVGLLPLALAGIDVEELLTGARRAVTDGLSPDLKKNHSIVSACLTHTHAQLGRNIRNTFLFSPRFEGLGKWERQLVAESLGKDGKGITPIVSIGSTALHSMAQLYWGGPDDKFTHLVSSFTGEVHAVAQHPALSGLVANIHGTSLESIMQAIYGGVKTAYTQKTLPFAEIDLGKADARELGYYLQFRMLEVMYLGRLMEVNAFDQPAVEMYKEVTRTLLRTRG